MKVKGHDYLLVSHLFPWPRDLCGVAVGHQFPGLRPGHCQARDGQDVIGYSKWLRVDGARVEI